MPDVADPHDELTREVYAHFGLAYYMTECVHRGLVSAYAMLAFKPEEATRPRIEERTAFAEQRTFGELLPMTKPFLPVELHSSLDWALAKRNFLAHGFWFDRIHMMKDQISMRELIDDLSETTDLLRVLSRALDALAFDNLRRVGVTDEMFMEAMSVVGSEPVEPSPRRRIPGTNELVDIIEAWIIRAGPGAGGLALRDSAGDMWQLCDAGLGWSYDREPEEGWVPFSKLLALLPAKIVARPKGARPWNYKLHVSTGALICVEREVTGGIRWSIKPVPNRGG